MDIDIDLKPDFIPDDYFDVIHASMEESGELKKHPVGVYFQNIPVDKETGFSAIPYKETDKIGYMKIDFLHLTLLNEFESKTEMRELLKKEPDWELLDEERIVKQLFHIGNHFDIISKVKPRSVLELSDVLALIRPGKRDLLNEYLRDREGTRKELYKKRINSDMRKSHTISYALLIVLQLHIVGKNEIFTY